MFKENLSDNTHQNQFIPQLNTLDRCPRGVKGLFSTTILPLKGEIVPWTAKSKPPKDKLQEVTLLQSWNACE